MRPNDKCGRTKRKRRDFLDPLLAQAFSARLQDGCVSTFLAKLLRHNLEPVDKESCELLQSFGLTAEFPETESDKLSSDTISAVNVADCASPAPNVTSNVADREAPKVTSTDQTKSARSSDSESAGIPQVQQHSLSKGEKKAFDALLEEFKDIFATASADVGHANRPDVVIRLKCKAPVVQRNYRTPLKYRDFLKRELKNLCDAGIIEISESVYNSPALVVPKKLDQPGSTDPTASQGARLVIDYRQLNKVIEDANYPMPRVQDLITQYKGCDVFTILDIRHAYYTIKLDPESRKITAFSCEFGKYQFCFLPQGLKISPAIFQQTITNALAQLEHTHPYMDDIITASSGVPQHLHHLREAFTAVRHSGFKLKKPKCHFLQTGVVFIGWMITPDGVAIAPEKLDDVRKLVPPKTVGEVRSLLGFVNFLRDHVSHFADLVAPIQELVVKGKGQHSTNISKFWTPVCERALQALKEALLDNQVLAYPDPQQPFDLYTDASGKHMSGVLMQNDRPIGYFAKSFKGTEVNWSALVKEAHAVYRAVEFFSVFISGAKVRLKCDHKPLEQFLHSMTKNAMVNRWSLNMQQYDIEFEWVATDKNISDCLSRLIESDLYEPHGPVESEFPERGQVVLQGCPLTVKPIEIPGPLSELDMVQIQQTDPYCKRIRKQMGTDHSLAEKFMIDKNVLYRVVCTASGVRFALVIPPSLALTILVNVHLELQHPGEDKMLSVIRRKVYWRGMKPAVKEYVKGCRVCQIKNAKQFSYSYLHDDPPTRPFMALKADLVSGFGTTSKGNVAVFTCICGLTQYPFAVPMRDKTAASVISAFSEVLAVINSCESLTTDNGPEFTAKEFEEFLVNHSIKHVKTAPYSPQSNGVMEKWHRYLNQVLKLCGIHRQGDDWEDSVMAALKAYRAMPHTASGESPHFLCFHTDPQLNIDVFLPILQRNMTDARQVDRVMGQLRVAYGLARKNLCLARRRAVNPRKTEPVSPIKVGDMVTVRQNHTSKSKPAWKHGYRVEKFTGTRTVLIEHVESKHRMRVGLQFVRRTEPLAILLENSNLDVFPGRSKLYLPAHHLPDLKWPSVDSGVDLGEHTFSKVLEACRDRSQDSSSQVPLSSPLPVSEPMDVDPPPVPVSSESATDPVDRPSKFTRQQRRHHRQQKTLPDQVTKFATRTRSGRVSQPHIFRDFVYASADVLPTLTESEAQCAFVVTVHIDPSLAH